MTLNLWKKGKKITSIKGILPLGQPRWDLHTPLPLLFLTQGHIKAQSPKSLSGFPKSPPPLCLETAQDVCLCSLYTHKLCCWLKCFPSSSFLLIFLLQAHTAKGTGKISQLRDPFPISQKTSQEKWSLTNFSTCIILSISISETPILTPKTQQIMNFFEILTHCFNNTQSHCKLPSRLKCLFKIGPSWPHFKMRTTDGPRKINQVKYFQFLFYTHILLPCSDDGKAELQLNNEFHFSWYTCALVFPHNKPVPGSGYRGNSQNQVFKHTKALHSKAPLRCFQFPSASYFKNGIMHWTRILWMEDFIRSFPWEVFQIPLLFTNWKEGTTKTIIKKIRENSRAKQRWREVLWTATLPFK